MQRLVLAAVVSCCLSFHTIPNLFADGPGDNIPDKVRSIPPQGIELSSEVRAGLQQRADEIRQRAANLPEQAGLKAEVEVFARAIELALEDSTIYSDDEVKQAYGLADLAIARAERIHVGQTSAANVGQTSGLNHSAASQATSSRSVAQAWLQAELAQLKPVGSKDGGSRLYVGGFRSRIDGSIQPYGLVIPATLYLTQPKQLRLDVWLHGRGEKNLELQFLHQRQRDLGEYQPANTIVLHPFGRYCNAFKFAGEIDVLEAIEHVKQRFTIDENRIAIRGFSMGGAGCWQMAVHYPGKWMAATPGAGFCETIDFLKVFQQEAFVPTSYQQSLLHLYDCPDWVNNLRGLPTIAYSGEIDKQKQAADLMVAAAKEQGFVIPHLIGPETAHKLHPESKQQISSQLTEITERGRPVRPSHIDFTTYTLRYPDWQWVSIERLAQHWQPTRIQVDQRDAQTVQVTTQNILAFNLQMEAGDAAKPVSVTVDGQTVSCPGDQTKLTLKQQGSNWTLVDSGATVGSLEKQPGLQGPIDDAFLSAFLFVRPQATSTSTKVDQWISDELMHAKAEWRRHFRGDILEKQVDQLTEQDRLNHNLILFGTPDSNPLITEVLTRLPIAWTKQAITVQGQDYPSDSHALIAIYPSPFAPNRYVVLNSGFTYREYAYLNNARQIAMLPDWAVVDVRPGANSQLPGTIPAAGFFDEQWQLPRK